MKESIFLRLGSLKEHDRLCHLYPNNTERMDIGSKFIIHGFRNKERCIYISDRVIPNEFIYRLEAAGIDINKARKQGIFKELTIFKKQADSMKEPQSFIDQLSPVLEEMSKNSNMTIRVLKNKESLFHTHENLLRREALLDKLSSEMPIIFMCQYDIKKIAGQDLMNLLSTHRLVVFENTLFDSPFYTLPDQILARLSQASSKMEVLTDKEKEILRYIVNGYSNNDIAEEISISVRTVETHRANIMRKLEINKLVDLVKFAIQNGIS
ncbi:MAG TPA: LuxR C-terminal-related transcriptional regulator [Thermodesulfobacteriota bacterium]|nr:LuxR C-terminal-related transcriptional regulator [Thermodesulfobacteriota bacterium]